MSNVLDNCKLFEEILKRPESETLDFKRKLYDFSDKDKYPEFVKDLLCLANTPRESCAYIVFGVSWTPEGGAVPHPLSTQPDDARIIDQSRAAPIVPTLAARYLPVLHDGQSFGILEIPVNKQTGRPYLPTKTLGNQIRREQLYLRSGSQNVEATFDDSRRVDAWFRNESASWTLAENGAGSWEEFLESVHQFEHGRYYILVADPIDRANRGGIAGLGMVPWLAVFDFDPDSEESGLLSSCRSSLELRRSLQIVVKGQSQVVHTRGGCCWYFSRGLSGRERTLQPGAFKDWLKDYGRETAEWVRFAAFGTSTPSIPPQFFGYVTPGSPRNVLAESQC